MSNIFIFSEDHQPIEEVHFNLWMVNEDEPFIDIGLLAKDKQEFVLYLPWDNVFFEDLYDRLKDEEILNALFNQHLVVTKGTQNSFITASRNEKRKTQNFFIAAFCNKNCFDVMEADYKITNNNIQNKKYTRMAVKRKTPTNNDAYIRFRVSGFKKNDFNKKYSITSGPLNPYTESVEAIDFRVNELRTAKREDFDESNNFETPQIKKLHFFLLKSYRETNSLASPNYYRCRELESDIWVKYLLPRNNQKNVNKILLGIKNFIFFNRKPEEILAYHWKLEKIEPGEHFSALACFSKKTASVRTILLYVFAFLFLNWLSSTVSNM